MSTALLRRNSSKQGLQKLLRVTAQRSVEDAEEVERELRRRLRESHRRSADPQEEAHRRSADPQEEAHRRSADPQEEAHRGPNDEEPKPGQVSSLEEDEGFSDGGAQRRERARRRQAGLDSGEEEVLPKETIWVSSQPRLRRQERQEEEKEATDGRMEQGGAARRERVEREKEEVVTRNGREVVSPAPNREIEHQKEAKLNLNKSKVFLQQEVVHSNTNGNTAPQEVTSYMKTKRPISHQEKENQEQEQLRQRQQEAEQELEVLKRRREERRRVREEEQRRDEGEQLPLAQEEEERSSMKGEMERRRTQAAHRVKRLSCSSSDQEEVVSPVCPRVPTPKTDSGEGRDADSSLLISERAESLSRSLKKSNSFKKTQSPVLLSRLDDRLEQYANAIETSQQEVRAVRPGAGDLPSPTGPLASRRSVFQAGEILSPSRVAPCKDTEGLKVGVANLITQWVKGSTDSSGKAPPSRPAEVRPGDVMQKKNMWEGIRDTERTGTSGATAGDTSGKKFKFVVTGHGKYQKL